MKIPKSLRKTTSTVITLALSATLIPASPLFSGDVFADTDIAVDTVTDAAIDENADAELVTETVEAIDAAVGKETVEAADVIAEKIQKPKQPILILL